jgi:hypothetical protein
VGHHAKLGWPAQPSWGTSRSPHGIAHLPVRDWPHVKVRDVARSDLEPASIDHDLSSVAERLGSPGSGAMTVLDDGAVVGVKTLRDSRRSRPFWTT